MARRARSLLTEDDLHLFNEGTHFRLFEKLGAHAVEGGTHFAVWAPDAEHVSVVGEFNAWERGRNPLATRGSSGIWEGFVPGVKPGALYKYIVASKYNGYVVEKSDPFAFSTEVPPSTASVVADLAYEWRDREWMGARRAKSALDAPISIYEVHVGSWRRNNGRSLSYRELADQLVPYVRDLGFTHVELLPMMEHPFYGSWGYQTTGYFAPTARYGPPADFMHLVDRLHQAGVGVILDWVPSHFPTDAHALGFFDGTHLYEHADPRQGFHPDWNSYIFNYGRNEVRSFLISSALFWLDRYHADGLRVDAVASMLYLDYSRREGEWVPNENGGRENLAAIGFLRRLNEEIYRSFPDVQTYAEESTSWEKVSRPTSAGGLGFGYKWDMGWMHDTLEYMKRDPIHRKHHQNQLTFRGLYSNAENFVLPLSHDEVVHGKHSLLDRMPGDSWQKFANMRLMLAYQYGIPGKKLLFMGGEFAHGLEWNHDASLDWDLLGRDPHRGVQRLVADLNKLMRSEPALHQTDCDGAGFEWIDCSDSAQSVLTFLRRPKSGPPVIVACNFTPEVRANYRIGVPSPGAWKEILNSDAGEYGGSGQGNLGSAKATNEPAHGRPHSIEATLPPLGAVFFRAP